MSTEPVTEGDDITYTPTRDREGREYVCSVMAFRKGPNGADEHIGTYEGRSLQPKEAVRLAKQRARDAIYAHATKAPDSVTGDAKHQSTGPVAPGQLKHWRAAVDSLIWAACRPSPNRRPGAEWRRLSKKTKMKKMLCLLAFAGFASAAVAQPAQAPAAPAASAVPSSTSASHADTTTFCYYEGKPYSKGAVLNDMVCVAAPTLVYDGTPRQLIWDRKKK